jgi:hypothetical protein
MKQVIGLLLIVVGVALGLYVGLWWAFIGGIVDIITEVKAPDLSAMNVAIGVAKILFAGFCGVLSASILVLPGAAMVKAA